ncbi:hypothetical protein [Microcoleus sp. FACHB-672]|uniref:hypothetical protein n=1 Tax=Microcoleus sp. FACHB-672 TaxID=2692825 RepID=UPI001689DB4E|nr:hypothetical protein [Microcoleus sp. FACHB-672]MBD2041727.1 hypothetical protein [Microcoleus sp. FACHB-672]
MSVLEPVFLAQAMRHPVSPLAMAAGPILINLSRQPEEDATIWDFPKVFLPLWSHAPSHL